MCKPSSFHKPARLGSMRALLFTAVFAATCLAARGSGAAQVCQSQEGDPSASMRLCVLDN
jgi:hypothetical protein